MCKYCDNDSFERLGMAGDGDLKQSIVLDGDWLELWETGPESSVVTKIARVNFCPVCGRTLVSGIDHVSMAEVR